MDHIIRLRNIGTPLLSFWETFTWGPEETIVILSNRVSALNHGLWDVQVISRATLSDDPVWRFLFEEVSTNRLGMDALNRYERHEIPSDDIQDYIRPMLFRCFDKLARWRMAEITHASTCTAQSNRERWETATSTDIAVIEPVSPLVAETADLFVKTGFYTALIALQVRHHRGRCLWCKHEANAKSLRVEITWRDMRMVREYAV